MHSGILFLFFAPLRAFRGLISLAVQDRQPRVFTKCGVGFTFLAQMKCVLLFVGDTRMKATRLT